MFLVQHTNPRIILSHKPFHNRAETALKIFLMPSECHECGMKTKSHHGCFLMPFISLFHVLQRQEQGSASTIGVLDKGPLLSMNSFHCSRSKKATPSECILTQPGSGGGSKMRKAVLSLKTTNLHPFDAVRHSDMVIL